MDGTSSLGNGADLHGNSDTEMISIAPYFKHIYRLTMDETKGKLAQLAGSVAFLKGSNEDGMLDETIANLCMIIEHHRAHLKELQRL